MNEDDIRMIARALIEREQRGKLSEETMRQIEIINKSIPKEDMYFIIS
jgi:hypothetical protein